MDKPIPQAAEQLASNGAATGSPEMEGRHAPVISEEKWREDAEKVLMSMHERMNALEAAVISQQRMMESIAGDLLAPKSRIIRAS